jgi:acetolactate synthase-1/2/3 large subunit
MLNQLGYRLLMSIPVLFGVLLLGFGLLQLIPGDAARVIAGPTATEGVARPMSHWVKTGRDSTTIAAEGAEALAAAMTPPGQVAALILPADTAWGPGGAPAKAALPPPRPTVDESLLREAAAALRRGRGTLMLLGAGAAREGALDLAAGIAARTGARLMGRTSLPRVERGQGRVELPRLPYYVDQALESLKDVATLILIGADDPVSFFGYPNRPSRMAPDTARILPLATPAHDLRSVLAELAADAVRVPRAALAIPRGGALTSELATAAVAALLPDGAIVMDESVSNARLTGPALAQAAPHDMLQLTGGSIGLGPSASLGAAVACPGRQVVNLEADGSAMYTLQALWSQARAKAKVVTVIWANRAYAILRGELTNVGALNPGRKALDMLSLDEPALDWVKLAGGMGVPARRAETLEEFVAAFRAGLAEDGPFLIEAVV